ncbi:MAG: aldo/keto reductase [Clostridiales bacterium]|nr:aldo/keto reductase [Clostridiales bacterium]
MADTIDINAIKKLGFGMMRLPKRGPIINVEETKQMVDRFMDAGFTYFDTAFIYPGSEDATRKALVERYPRESFTLATKLIASVAPTEKIAKQEFKTSLKRTGAGYFDFYLLHTLMANNYKKYEKLHLWDFVKEQKEKGLIKHIGFSFHDGPELLEEILTDHPEAEFVQLQINYADWENPKVTSRANYEVARKHNIPIVIMEPVKGGSLADPDPAIKKLFEEYNKDASPASWAIRFAASLEGVLAVLSGMSNIAQIEDNISYMKDFKPLNEDEQKIIRKAQEILGRSKAIPCTACSYCTKGCPKEIAIPDIFSAVNMRVANGQIESSKDKYLSVTSDGHRAGDCISCGKCEEACPQHLEIRKLLASASENFDI